MVAQTEAEETALLETAFSRYRSVYTSLNEKIDLAPYGHIQTEKSIPIAWAVYHEMLRDHIKHLANDLNHFAHHILQLSAWADVLSEYEIEDQLALLMEFVTPVAVVSVNYPYAIKSRYQFSISHLSHQANMILDQDYCETKLPRDEKIDFKIMQRVSRNWSCFEKLSRGLSRLCDEAYKEETGNHRHKYNHRYPPRFEHGLTQMVTREVYDSGRVGYGVGNAEPLRLKEILPSLKEQHTTARGCFDLYSDLINEQLLMISTCD